MFTSPNPGFRLTMLDCFLCNRSVVTKRNRLTSENRVIDTVASQSLLCSVCTVPPTVVFILGRDSSEAVRRL